MSKPLVATLIAAGALLGACILRCPEPAPAASGAAAPAPELRDGAQLELLVGVRPGLDAEARVAALAEPLGGRVVGSCPPLGYAVVRTPAPAAAALATALREAREVDYVEANRSARPAAGLGRCSCQGTGRLQPPALDLHGLGELVHQLRLEEAWAESPGRGAGVRVGLVDTGVDRGCVALQGALEPAVDLVSEGGQGEDHHGHGTTMAGIIAGRGDGQRGFLGVAAGAKVLPVRVADEQGEAPLERVARGILVAAERGARVIYVGLGVRGESPTLARAVEQARALGALVVAPTGNDGLDLVRWPAGAPGALGVTGSSEGRHLALAANVNAGIRLSAPAEYVPAPRGDQAVFTDGTSSSAALTAGVAALLLGEAPGLDVVALERALLAGARPLPGERPQDGPAALLELDAAGALAAARPQATRLRIEAVRTSPWPPCAGRPLTTRLTVWNGGQVALDAGAVRWEGAGQTLATGELPALAPGARAEVVLTGTCPATWAGHEVELALRAEGVGPAPAGAGPALPCLASSLALTPVLAEPTPNVVLDGLTLLEAPTLERPGARFRARVRNQGSARAEGQLRWAVEGRQGEPRPLALAPGEEGLLELSWTPQPDRSPAGPVELEVLLEAEGDPDPVGDAGALRISLVDPSLPLDPQYWQAGEIDLGIDAPWRLAGDQPSLPLLVFVPSIGRASRYATFEETLALRRGLARSGGRRAEGQIRAVLSGEGRGIVGRVRGAASSAAGAGIQYTAAMFIKEMVQADFDNEAAVRTFLDRVVDLDFAIDFGLYSVGAASASMAYRGIASRLESVPGRWTGTNLRSTLGRTQAIVMAGYLLPNLVRGRAFNRRVLIDLGTLGVTTALAEVFEHFALKGMAAAGTRLTAMRLGQDVASWLARNGRKLQEMRGAGAFTGVGGFAWQVGKLAVILIVTDTVSERIEDWMVRRDCRKALASSYAALDAACRGQDEAAFTAALREFLDAFDSYRNLQGRDLEEALRQAHEDLKKAAIQLNEAEARRAALAERLRERLDQLNAGVLEGLRRTFLDKFGQEMNAIYDFDAEATLDDPGASRPAVYELQGALLERLASSYPARAQALRGEAGTLARQKDLEEEVVAAILSGGRNPEQEEPAVRQLRREGLLLRQARITVRDSWHQETSDAAALEARPNKFAPPGSVRERVVYEHDVDKNLYRAAPGVIRLDEEGRPQAGVALFDTPQPLTVKGRYNMLRLPRALLEPLAVGGVVYVQVDTTWAVRRRQAARLMDVATHQHTQMLRVELGEGAGLPWIPGLNGGYLDAHYHTIAEWYNPEPGFVANLEFDAPRQKYGGPIPMLVESAQAVGAIPPGGESFADKLPLVRDRLITTDHNAFYVPGDDLAHRPPFGPTSPLSSGGADEQPRMRELLGESAAEELCYGGPDLKSVGVHMLDYRARHYDGTWNGKQPLFRWVTRLKNLEVPTMERVLGDMAAGGEGSQHAFAYASHPVSTIPWEDSKLRAALTQYVRPGDQSYPFKGIQVWNTRSGRHHSLNKIVKWLDDMNPFVSRNWQSGTEGWDAEVNGGVIKYRQLLREMLAVRHPLDARLRVIRKNYMVAGSDSHGDFNYTVGGLATVVTALVDDILKYTAKTLEVHDSSFMRVRTFVATDGFSEPRFMEALAHGSSAVTDGPLVWFEVDGDACFDAGRGRYDAKALERYEAALTRGEAGAGAELFRDTEGRIGGSGPWDGGRTALVVNDARPVIRYVYTNSDEFGRPVERDALKRVTRSDGSVERIAVYKTDRQGAPLQAEGSTRLEADGDLPIDPPGFHAQRGRSFGRALFSAWDPARLGALGDVTALQLGAWTAARGDTSDADVYRCITNPVWIVRLQAVAHIDPARFDAQAGVIQPGGLVLELRSPVSLGRDALSFAVKALGADGKSGDVLASLTPLGWADGVDEAGAAYSGGVFLAENREPISLRGLTPAGGAQLTLVAMSKAPLRDAFGNALSRVAVTFSCDPASGAPGAWADASPRGSLPQVSLTDRPTETPGIAPTLEGSGR